MNFTFVSTIGNVMTQQNDLIRACSWCDMVEGLDGHWNDIFPALRQEYESSMRLTHGMCPPCYKKNLAAISLPN